MKLSIYASYAILAVSPAFSAPYSFTPLPSGFYATSLNNVGAVAGVVFGPIVNSAPAVYANGALTIPNVPPSNGFYSTLTGINDAGDLLGETNNGRSPFTVFDSVVGEVAAPGLTSGGRQVKGLNNSRQIVGSATVFDGQTSSLVSFVSSGNTYAVVNVPGKAVTNAAGINNFGTVVGNYSSVLYGPGDEGGFVDQGGTFTTFTVPGAVETFPVAINDAMEIVGTYTATDGSSHGFTDMGGVFSDVTGPDGSAFLPVGLNNSGQLVGSFGDAGLNYLAKPATINVPEPAPAGIVAIWFAGLGLGALTRRRRVCGTQSA